MDRLMHLWNNQLGKLVSPLSCDDHQLSKINLEKMVKAICFLVVPLLSLALLQSGTVVQRAGIAEQPKMF